MNYVLNKKKRILAVVVDSLLKYSYYTWKTISFEEKRKKKKSLDEVQKILVVDCGLLGDTVISFPAVASIRERFPKATISILVNPQYKDLWKYSTDYDELIDYTAPWLVYKSLFTPKSIREYFALRKFLRNKKFDLAIDLRGDLRNILFLVYGSGAPLRAGTSATGGSYLLTHDAPYPDAHEVENNLAVAKFLGGKEKPYLMKVNSEERKKIAELTKDLTKPIIVIFPTPGYEIKAWSNDKWARVCDELVDYQVILSGAKDDSNIHEIIALSKSKPLHCVLNLNELAALVQKAKLVIGVDTGPMHLASAVGGKLIELMAPTAPERWGAYKNAVFVKRQKMSDIAVEDVVKEVISL